jgi:hypothetical protein
MAFAAGNGEMLSDEGIFRRPMIELDLFPFRRDQVAPVAPRSQFFLMIVVFPVTVEAEPRSLLDFGRRVAGDAVDFAMNPDELVFKPVMVKFHPFPAFGGVAGFAILAEIPLMFVLLRMTPDAGFRRLAGFLKRQMALSAGGFLMLSFEPEFRFVVIEPDLFPFPWRVAIFADLPERPFMLVLLFMAGKAILRRLFEILRGVTLFAGNRPLLADQVASGQGKMHRVMIESGILP